MPGLSGFELHSRWVPLFKGNYSSKTELKRIKESIHKLLVSLNSKAVVHRDCPFCCPEFDVLNIIQWAVSLGSNLIEKLKDVFVITRILLVEAWVLIKITILSIYNKLLIYHDRRET